MAKTGLLQLRLAMTTSYKSAFTLVELSIVLVIIGFITGGILLGKDLIHSAEIRSQVSQLQRFDSAVTTFKLKYGYLPRDISNADAIAFGLATKNWTGSCACQKGGNEDGIIEDNGYPIVYIQNEAYLFFIHLAKANLITDVSGNLQYPYGDKGCYTNNSNYHQYIGCQYPAAKIGSGGFTATSLANTHLAYFLGMTATDATASYNNYTVATGSDGNGVITPADAYALDTKLDDGLPLSGKIMASKYPAAPETRSNYCLTSVANNTYNVTNTNIACNLLIQSSGQ